MLTFAVILPAFFVIGVAIILFVISFKHNKGDNGKKKLKGKDKAALIREANKRIAQNPKDADALKALADLYYNDGAYEKSFKLFETLVDLCAMNKELDEFDISLKYALSALKIKNMEEAYKSLAIARTMRQDVFEVNYNLGYLEYLRKNYDKAAALLNQARKDQPDHVQTLRYLGHSLFKLQNYKESVVILRKVIDLEPEDKESLFSIAQCYHNLGQNDQAIRIFTHLRPDPQIGPAAALYAGTIHLNAHQTDKAILDFSIGLKHLTIAPEILLELKYRLAATYIKDQNLSGAIKYLEEINSANPAYKDVPVLLRKYSELNSNQNLQTFLIAPASDFLTLCRKVVISFFPYAKVKIVDISVQKNEYADILAEVSTKKWEDLILFRFVRTTNQVGELILRDLYTRIKELKAGRGFCLTAGTFTDGAKQFVEARLIDLIEKDDLVKRLTTVGHLRIDT
jgi:tetratricopeptide (TPR) repeat protein